MSNFQFSNQITADSVHSTLDKYILADGYDLVLDIYESKDGFLKDKRSNRQILDMFTCYASMPLGFNHHKLWDKDFIEYIGKVALNKPSNSDIYTEEKATFVETFFKLAVPDGFKYSFFVEGGALAVENALKVAFDWKVQKNFKKGYQSETGTKVLHFKEAFHGRTGYTMSLTNTEDKKIKYFPKFDWPRVDTPKLIFPIEENNDENIARENEIKSQIEKCFIENKDEIACIIIEPIQGEGGDNHFSNEFFKFLRMMADEYDALLIFDEVQTGVGLTGTMWYAEQLPINPDIIAFGKKMQVCGIIVGDKIDDIDTHVFRQSSRINSTWGGNLTDMVRATRYLEIINEEQLLINVLKQGDFLHSLLLALKMEFPDLISNVRGKGLFRAVDIKPEIRDKFIKECYAQNLLILSCGKQSIRFRPPLNVTKDNIELGIDTIRKSLQKLK